MYLFNLPVAQVVGTSLLSLLAMAPLDEAPANAELPTRGSLTVQVSGLENTNGQVCFSLYDSSTGFPDEPEAVIAKQCVAADMGAGETLASGQPNALSSEVTPTAVSLSVTFSELSMGTYAVSVLHDENEDEQLNQGTFGIPIEGFGFSRNPVIQAGAPSFYETAVFVFGRTTTAVEMVYF